MLPALYVLLSVVVGMLRAKASWDLQRVGAGIVEVAASGISCHKRRQFWTVGRLESS
jgi:hypothetical protein